MHAPAASSTSCREFRVAETPILASLDQRLAAGGQTVFDHLVALGGGDAEVQTGDIGQTGLDDEVAVRVDVAVVAGEREVDLAHREVEVEPVGELRGQRRRLAEDAEDGGTAAELGRAVVIQRAVAQQLHSVGAVVPLGAEDAWQRARRSDGVRQVVVDAFEDHRCIAHDVAGDDAQVVVGLQVVALHHVTHSAAQVEQSADGERDRVRNGAQAAEQGGERVATVETLEEDLANLLGRVAVGVEGRDDRADRHTGDFSDGNARFAQRLQNTDVFETLDAAGSENELDVGSRQGRDSRGMRLSHGELLC